MSKNIFAIVTASLGGGLLRYVIDWLFAGNGIAEPYATLLINVTGAFLLGMAITLAHIFNWQNAIRNGICTGAIGSFTTFSRFALDALHILSGHPILAMSYVGISVAGGVGAFIAGRFLVLYWIASIGYPSSRGSTH